MAKNEGFDDGDHLGPVGTFSQLLFSADRVVGLQDLDQSSTYRTFSSASKPPKMLCFGNFGEEAETGELLFPPAARTRTCQKSGLTCSDSSSTSSINDTKLSFNAVPKSNKRRYGSAPAQCKSALTPAPATQRNCKKNKTDNPAPTKARKEKLGERIATLQQLVSPFGKTDTASVLHEAMGYIRFLHEQVQVLCSPYLQGLPSSSSAQHHHQPEEEEGGSGECDTRKDLRSRGLCLVPVESTVHVDNSNGADFWSPAMGHSAVVSSATATTKL